MYMQITTALALAFLTSVPQLSNAQSNSIKQVAVSIRICERVSEASIVKVLANPTIVATVGKSFSMHSGGSVNPKVGEGKLEFGTQVTGEFKYSDNGMLQAALKICLGEHKKSDTATDIVLSESLEVRTIFKPGKTQHFDYSQARWCEVHVKEVQTEEISLRGPFKINHTFVVPDKLSAAKRVRVSLNEFGGEGKIAVHIRHAGEPGEGPISLSVVGLDASGTKLFTFEEACTDNPGGTSPLDAKYGWVWSSGSQPEFQFPLQALHAISEIRLGFTRL